MKRILVAIDGSDHARRALDIAADLAVAHVAELTLIHVVSQQEPSEAARRAVEAEFSQELVSRSQSLFKDTLLPGDALRADAILSHHRDLSRIVNAIMAENLIASARDHLRDRQLDSVQALLVEGDPDKRILDLADGRNIDTIVMGCRGVGRVHSALLGSVSQSVAHKSKGTVIIVK